MNSEVTIMSKQSIVQAIVNRNVERLLVREFLMKNTKKSGFGGLEIRRTPAGTDVTVHAERPGMVIGRKGKIINEHTLLHCRDIQKKMMIYLISHETSFYDDPSQQKHHHNHQ